ncbi:pyruvate kinase [Marinoscillum furvescens]|uniref:Pyruvate kinase n=1 Tax=Marinoscillum furvescens DSM 4134 TaxID=1122208 RepID=A0A3D9L2N2_MARFU|nr:pyruvate kinase [Marinoscillum furvescens]RED96644.1 pyruvate kinase [Marinoscillum furvescens DSM 4134]
MKEALFKKTKIVATIGPASRNKETLRELIKAGANVFRLNFSHGSHEDHQSTIQMVRELNEELGANVALLQDLQGPKIRVGKVENDGVPIAPGQPLIITTEEMLGTSEKVSTVYEGIVNDVKPGDTILIDDGNIELKTIKVDGNNVHTEVVHGELLKSRKGINLPNSNVSAPSMTEKDIEDLEFAFQFDLEWVALSFVRKASDIIDIKERIKKAGINTKVIAKIEKPEAITNLDEIIEQTDGLMVARGDLGVEVPSENVPLLQKRMVKKCNEAGKPVIIATQMMESMIENPRPTRAETNDVANAVFDGADALMLSAESASGKFPVQAVQQMAKTIVAIESEANSIYSKYHDEKESSSTRLNDLLVRSACRMSDQVGAQALVGMTKSGYTAYRLSKHRPKSYIFIFTNQKHLLRQLNLLWGVTGFYYDKTEGIDETLQHIETVLVNDGYLQKGDVFVNTASMPMHWKGHTNMMRVSQVE